MLTPKITITDLRVTFPGRGRTGEVEALGGVSLDVAEGELLCVVGPSGCGKTTLLRVLAGLEQPTGGSAHIRSDHSELKSEIRNPKSEIQKAMVFQGAGIFPWMTVEQNVAYGLRVRGVPGAERMMTASRWIREIGLQRFSNAYPSQLSGGMQQRVGLARAFATDPEVLLMDEPFGALDAQTRLLLQQTLLEVITNYELRITELDESSPSAHREFAFGSLKDEGENANTQYAIRNTSKSKSRKTVVFVTHSIEEALTLGDRILVMSARPGRLIHEVKVPFERPRDAVALRTDPRFSALFAEIWESLREEVMQAQRAEGVAV